MKKFTIILVVMCLLAGFAFTAMACVNRDNDGKEILGKPNITMVGNVVKWDSVKNAKKYSVNITGENLEEQNVEKETNSITLGPFDTNVAKVHVKVKSVGDGETTSDSEYSKTLEYTPGLRLPTPQINKIEQDGDNYKLTWNAIDKATAYKVKMVCVGNTSKNKEYSVSEGTTQLVIDKKDMTTPAKYVFTIQALGNGEQNIIESAWGGESEVTVSVQLNAPKKVYYSKTGIFWNSVDKAKEYNVYYAQFESDEYELLDTVTSASYRLDKLVENDKLTIGVKYKFKVSASNKDNSTIYKESEKSDVMDSSDVGADVAEFTKLSEPTNLVLSNNILTFKGTVDAIAGYTIELQSGEDNKVEFKIDFTADSLNYTVDLDEKFKTKNDLGTFGEVYTIKVYANSTDDGSLAESKRIDVVDSNNILSEYVYTGYFEEYKTKDWQKATINEETYKIVTNLAEFVFMLNDSDANARYTINSFNGNGAKIYGGGEFRGILDGRGGIARNFRLIKKDDSNAYSLFTKLNSNAKIANISFIDVLMDSNVIEVTNEDEEKINTFNENYIGKNSAFLTMINEGTIDGIYYNANVLATGNHGGLVFANKGAINNSNVSGTILAEGNVGVGGLVYENSGNISNSYLTDATVKLTNVIDGVVSGEKDITFMVGGMVARGLSGNIKNSGVLNSVIAIDKSCDVNGTVSAYVGGFIGINTSMNIENSYIETLTTSASKTSVSVKLSSKNTSPLVRYAGGFIGKSQSGNISNSYARNIAIGGQNVISGGAIANLATDASNININNIFIDNCSIYGGNKDALLPQLSDAVTVTDGYFLRTEITSVYNGMIQCTLNDLKEIIMEGNGEYVYNDTLGIVLKDTLIVDNSLLNPSRTSTGRILYAKVFQGNTAYTKPTISASIDKNGNYVDRYVVGDKVFFVTVKVK